MKKYINLYLIEYAINSILRERSKTIFIATIFSMLVGILSSIFFITNSIRYELNATVDALPQIIVQKSKAGRHYDISSDRLDEILAITGVSDGVARVWGYYFFENLGINFTLVGIDEYEKQYREGFAKIVKEVDSSKFSDDSMIVGRGVFQSMKSSYYSEYFNFIKPDGTLKRVSLGGVFDGSTSLESNDMIVMSKDMVREIFDIDENRATDLVITVPNPEEIPMVASKIKLMFPDTRVITKDDLKISYQNIFDYKSGIFLAMFIVSLFTFFIVIYDKSSGLSSEYKREIGILKAIGWTIDDILKEKFYEAFIISFISYLIGIIFAFAFVYIFDAPLMQNIFTGYSQLKTDFDLPFIIDTATLFLIFLLTVPIYISATIIPSWRVATLEADEVIR